MTHEVLDIEVYVRTKSAEPVIVWLNERFSTITPKQSAGMPKNSHVFRVEHDQQSILVIIQEGSAKGYCSVLFDSPNSPWQSDADLAAELHQALGFVVRYSDGLWGEGQDPDAWIQMDSHGTRQINWKI